MQQRWTHDDLVSLMSQPVIGGWRTMLPLFVAVALIGSSAFMLGDKLNTLPKVPDTIERRTWRLEDHGRIVYGTFSEIASVYGLFMAGWIVGAVGMSNEKRRRAELARGKEQESD